jgi:peptidoglycan/LPS O-acetylase OafA/YrhL
MNGSTFGLRLLSRRGPQLLVLGLLAILVLAFRSIQFVLLTSQIQWGYDFSAYWTAASRLIAGGSPYAAAQLTGPYPPQAQYLFLYPPPMAALAEPLAVLFPSDYRAAAWIWFALLLFVPRRFLVPGILAGIAGSIALQLVVVGAQGDVLAHFRPDVRADAILWGCLIALVPVRVPRWAVIAAGAGLLALSLSFLWPYAIGLSSILSAVVVAGAATVARPLSWRPLVRIGQISYGLYLWHAIPVGLFQDQTLAGNVLAMVAVVAITFALALISERWIERPFRRPRTAQPKPLIAEASGVPV